VWEGAVQNMVKEGNEKTIIIYGSGRSRISSCRALIRPAKGRLEASQRRTKAGKLKQVGLYDQDNCNEL